MTTKLQQLAKDWGFETPTQLVEEYIYDGVMPSICMNPGCDYSTEMEPDQDEGWCECCGTNTLKSAAVLLGVI